MCRINYSINAMYNKSGGHLQVLLLIGDWKAAELAMKVNWIVTEMCLPFSTFQSLKGRWKSHFSKNWNMGFLLVYDNKWVLRVMTSCESCELWQQVSPVYYDNRWVLWVTTTGVSCESWQQVSLVSYMYDNRWVLWVMTTDEYC